MNSAGMEHEEELTGATRIIRPLRVGREFAPNYSTEELLRGVCHIVPGIRKKERDRNGKVIVKAQWELTEARRTISREKFTDNREAIYEMLKTRGKKATARHFHIGQDQFRQYLEEDKYEQQRKV